MLFEVAERERLPHENVIIVTAEDEVVAEAPCAVALRLDHPRAIVPVVVLG